jgi:hypothetical protein
VNGQWSDALIETYLTQPNVKWIYTVHFWKFKILKICNTLKDENFLNYEGHKNMERSKVKLNLGDPCHELQRSEILLRLPKFRELKI